MRLKRMLSFLLAFALAVSMTACVDQHPEENQAAEDEQNPRLIATSATVAEICSRLQLGLVGVCETQSPLPAEYRDLPRVGMAMSPDLEIIKTLDPDYILSPATLMGDQQPKYAGIGEASIFLDLKSVEGMYASIEELGSKFGRENEARELREEFDSFLREFQKGVRGKASPRVLILMGLPGAYIAATESSYIGSLVRLAGGENVYGDGEGQEFLRANTEDMKMKEPDVILRAAHAMPDQVKQMFDEEFASNDIWRHFQAVKDGRVYDLDPALFNMSANFRYTEALRVLQPILYGD